MPTFRLYGHFPVKSLQHAACELKARHGACIGLCGFVKSHIPHCLHRPHCLHQRRVHICKPSRLINRPCLNFSITVEQLTACGTKREHAACIAPYSAFLQLSSKFSTTHSRSIILLQGADLNVNPKKLSRARACTWMGSFLYLFFSFFLRGCGGAFSFFFSLFLFIFFGMIRISPVTA